MNKICAIAAASVLTLPLSLSAFAEKDPERKLQGETELGIIATSGNTETKSYKGKVDVKHETTHWVNQYLLEALYKRDQVEVDDGSGDIVTEDQTTAEKYFASAQSDYRLNKDHAALFIYADFERKRFSGFARQYTFALGYSDRLFTTDNSHLSYSIGPGVTFAKPEDVDGVSQDTDESFVIRLSGKYVYAFSENAKFSQSLSTNYAPSSSDNTKTKSVTALTAQLNGSLALRASYTVDYNSEVPADTKHADTETAVTVVYSF